MSQIYHLRYRHLMNWYQVDAFRQTLGPSQISAGFNLRHLFIWYYEYSTGMLSEIVWECIKLEFLSRMQIWATSVWT
jgi:hypothetical protein